MVWVPQERVLCAGDIVVNPIPYAAASYPAEWVSVLKKLEGFDYSVLIPGHGEPETNRAYIDRMIETLEDVRAQVKPLAEAAVPLEEVYKRTNFERVRTNFAGDDPWLRFLLEQVFLRSIVKNAYYGATGRPIVQGES